MTFRPSRRSVLSGFGALSAGLAGGLPRPARANDFYQGKTLTVIVGFAPGGGVDTTARMVARHLVRFIPGQPSLVIQNMEGAAGIVAANHVGRRVAPDGLTLAVPGRSWFVEGIVKNPGATYDPTQFAYVGSPGAVNSMVWVRVEHRDQELRRSQVAPEDVELRLARQHHADRDDPDHARGQRRADQGDLRLRLDRARPARAGAGRDRRRVHGRGFVRPPPGPHQEQGRHPDPAEQADIARAFRWCATCCRRASCRCSRWRWRWRISDCRWSDRPASRRTACRSCARRSSTCATTGTTAPRLRASTSRSARRSRAALLEAMMKELAAGVTPDIVAAYRRLASGKQ